MTNILLYDQKKRLFYAVIIYSNNKLQKNILWVDDETGVQTKTKLRPVQ